MADVIKSIVTRIDTTANWTTLNPIPANGEQCIEILGRGLFKLKVGDGVTPWIALKYETLSDGFEKFKRLLEKEVIARQEGDKALQFALVEGLATKVTHYDDLPEVTEHNAGEIAQYIGETTKDYTEGYFYKAIYDPEHPDRAHWERISVQPETDLDPLWDAIENLDHKVDEKVEELNQKIDNTTEELRGEIQDVEESLDNKKVDKTHEAFKIYGTDENGNQVVYDKEDFGKVDDVRINNTSIVTDKIANIEVDSEVTEDSEHFVTSGGVFSAISEATPLYTADEPSTVEVGGFPLNSQPVNMTFAEFADKLLHKYIAPTNTLAINPSTSPLQLGTTLDVVGTSTVTRKATSDYPLTKLVFYNNNVAEETITENIDVKTGTFKHTFTNVGTTANTKYFVQTLKSTLTDSKGSTATDSKSIAFVAPTFYGKVSIPAEYDDTPAHVKEYLQNNIETIISNLTKKITTSGTIDNPCTLTKEHYIFVTPFNWSGTKKIYDTITNIDYTNSTSTFTHNHNENGVITTYNVYYLTDYTGSGNSFIFRLTVTVQQG